MSTQIAVISTEPCEVSLKQKYRLNVSSILCFTNVTCPQSTRGLRKQRWGSFLPCMDRELLVIAFCSSLVSYWTPSNLEDSSSSVIFLPFHIVHGFLAARILVWFAIPSSSRPHILPAELFTVTCPS